MYANSGKAASGQSHYACHCLLAHTPLGALNDDGRLRPELHVTYLRVVLLA